MLINVVLCQLKIGAGISLAEKIHIFKRKPDLLCLPEYFLMPENSSDYSLFASRYRENLKHLSRLSNELNTTLIGGTIIEKSGEDKYNTSYVFKQGTKIASYRKRHPTENEKRMGIRPGSRSIVFSVNGVRVGILICADALDNGCFQKMQKMNADIIFIPTVSPLRKDDNPAQKARRDQDIFVEGARTAGAYIVKTCGIGSIFEHRLNGRSLVASPWGILWQIPSPHEQLPYIHNTLLDIDELREFKHAALISEVLNSSSNQNYN